MRRCAGRGAQGQVVLVVRGLARERVLWRGPRCCAVGVPGSGTHLGARPRRVGALGHLLLDERVLVRS